MTGPVHAPSRHRLPDVSTLFPWHAWVSGPALRSGTTWLFVALVAVPPLACALSNADDLTTATVVLAGYFAVVWFLVLRAVVRPRAVGGAVLLAVVAAAVLLEGPLALALEGALRSESDTLVRSIVTVGVPEELVKLLPVVAVVLWFRRRGRPLPPREALFVGAVSGLGFGAVEAVLYVADDSALLTADDALTVVWRLVCGPVGHACWAGVGGYFVGLASYYRDPAPAAALAGLGLGVTATLHGVNNVVAGGPLWVVVTVVSALLFLAYARVGVARRQAPGPAPAPAPAPADPVTAPIALGRHHLV